MMFLYYIWYYLTFPFRLIISKFSWWYHSPFRRYRKYTWEQLQLLDDDELLFASKGTTYMIDGSIIYHFKDNHQIIVYSDGSRMCLYRH